MTAQPKEPYTYKSAGVDIDAGAALVEAIKPLAKSTARPGSEAGLGGFGGLFDLKAAGYQDPVLVSGTDGVGTKLKIAFATGLHDTVGIDLVAMCVNDIVVQGAEPLFFLDYFATGKLEIETAQSVVRGIAEGCRQAGCALIGGETAEMPGMYAPGEYDLAGFAVGAAERERLITGAGVGPGDVVLGLASSGLHANGFSLVRRLIDDSGLDLGGAPPFSSPHTLGGALLEPTRIYVRPCLAAAATGKVRAMAHITGGGLIENLPRALPAGCAVAVDPDAWERPPVFDWLMQAGAINDEEMFSTFNCGIGMAVVCAPEGSQAVIAALRQAGETVYRIGRVIETGPEGEAVVFSPGLAG